MNRDMDATAYTKNTAWQLRQSLGVDFDASRPVRGVEDDGTSVRNQNPNGSKHRVARESWLQRNRAKVGAVAGCVALGLAAGMGWALATESSPKPAASAELTPSAGTSARTSDASASADPSMTRNVASPSPSVAPTSALPRATETSTLATPPKSATPSMTATTTRPASTHTTSSAPTITICRADGAAKEPDGTTLTAYDCSAPVKVIGTGIGDYSASTIAANTANDEIPYDGGMAVNAFGEKNGVQTNPTGWVMLNSVEFVG